MDQSNAAEASLEAAASAGPRTRSQSRSRDSSLSEPISSPTSPPVVMAQDDMYAMDTSQRSVHPLLQWVSELD
jgi:hypothetical protein